MILNANSVSKICNGNTSRTFFSVQNLAKSPDNYIFLLPYETEPQNYVRNGYVLGGMGLLEIPNCSMKGAWYAYTTVPEIDIRILDV